MNPEWVLANLAYLGYIQGEEENQLTAVRGRIISAAMYPTDAFVYANECYRIHIFMLSIHTRVLQVLWR